MALEKKKVLRKMEITFTDDEMHDEVHYEYETQVLEDGNPIAKKTLREVKPLDEAKQQISSAKKRERPAFVA